MDNLTTTQIIIIVLVTIALVTSIGYFIYKKFWKSEGLKSASYLEDKPAEIHLPSADTHEQVVDKALIDPCSQVKTFDGRPMYTPSYNDNVEPRPAIQEYACPPNPDAIQPEDLLPQKNPNDVWEFSAPSNPGSLEDKNFLESAHHYGINTVGSSLRNANRQIRSDPPIPRKAVSIWHQSTIEPDTNRRPLEIGEVDACPTS